MELVEVRELEGPNVFLLRPAIKIELRAEEGDLAADALARLVARLEPLGVNEEERPSGADALGELLRTASVALHERAGQPEPETAWSVQETPGHYVLAFGWERRRFAVAVAGLLAAAATGATVDLAAGAAGLAALLDGGAADDRPGWVRDVDRARPVVAVTGTNGKTTTTRLIAHVLRGAGRRVGWTSTMGVFVEGEMVLDGDYTGPAGAWRVLAEPDLDVAVLETARGGILLRGLAYESNDVSVMTNISGDHLGLQGVRTVDGLAKVKATVARVTRPSGYAVLNADDARVRGLAGSLHASPFWVTREAAQPVVLAHVAAGGRALLVRDGTIVEAQGGSEAALLPVAEVTIAFGGRARHMLENALCGAAACLALGLEPEAVAAGLRSFGRDPGDNVGRLHVYDLDGATVIVDYAHNEVGLRHLLEMAGTYRGEGGRLTAIVGTAGDRSDDALREIGRLAASAADRVLIKETTRYLRGRASAAEMNDRYREGIAAGGGTPHEVFDGELAALDAATGGLRPGDAVAMMCIEEGEEVRRRLAERGRPAS